MSIWSQWRGDSAGRNEKWFVWGSCAVGGEDLGGWKVGGFARFCVGNVGSTKKYGVVQGAINELLYKSPGNNFPINPWKVKCQQKIQILSQYIITNGSWFEEWISWKRILKNIAKNSLKSWEKDLETLHVHLLALELKLMYSRKRWSNKLFLAKVAEEQAPKMS